jgi:WW domain/IPT/TIG domain
MSTLLILSITIVSSLFTTYCHATVNTTPLPPDWNLQFGTPASESLSGVAIHPNDRSITLCGSTQGSLFSPALGLDDIYVVKLNRSGSIIWGFQNGTDDNEFVSSCALTHFDSSVVAVGDTHGNFARTNPDRSASDVFAIKVNASGQEVWRIQIGSPDEDYPFDVAVDQRDGSIAVVGYTGGTFLHETAGAADFMAFKLNSTGHELWRYQAGTSASDYAVGVAVDPWDSSIVFCGWTIGRFGSWSYGSQDAVIVKLYPDGTENWRIQYGTSSYEFATGIAIDPYDSSIISVGSTVGTFGNEKYGGLDAFIVKYSKYGWTQFRTQVGTLYDDDIYAVTVNSMDSSIVFCGSTFGDFAHASQGGADGIAFALDYKGNELWRLQSGSPYSDVFRRCAIDQTDGSIIFGGRSRGLYGPSLYGSYDAIVARASGVKFVVANITNVAAFEPTPNVARLLVSMSVWTPRPISLDVCILVVPQTAQFESTPITYQTVTLGILDPDPLQQCVRYTPTVSGPSQGSFNVTVSSLWSGMPYSVYAVVSSDTANRIQSYPSLFTTPPVKVMEPPDNPPDWRYETTIVDDAEQVQVTEFYASAIDPSDSSIIAVGVTKGNVIGKNAGYRDLMAMKFDSNGNELWRYQIGSVNSEAARSVAVDTSDSSILITGHTEDRLFGWNYGGWDGYVLRLDRNGNQVSAFQFGSSSVDSPYAITVDPNDFSFTVGGYTSGQISTPDFGGTDSFFVKFNSAGVQQWALQFGTAKNDDLFDTAVDPVDGSIVGIGTTAGSFGGPFLGFWDVYVIRVNSTGSIVWNTQVGTDSLDQPFGVAIDPNDQSVVVTGYTLGDFGSAHLGEGDFFVFKLDKESNMVWKRQYGTTGSDVSSAIAIDMLDSSIVFGGYTSGDFANLAHGREDAIVVKMLSDGTSLYIYQFGSSSEDSVDAISVDSHSNIVAVGKANDKAVFVTQLTGSYTLVSSQISALSVLISQPTTVSISLFYSMQTHYPIGQKVCAIAYPAALFGQETVRWRDVIGGEPVLDKYPAYTAQLCSDWRSDQGNLTQSLVFTGLKVNTEYSVVASFTELNRTFAFPQAFRTALAPLLSDAKMVAADSVIGTFTNLSLSLSLSLTGNPSAFDVRAVTDAGFMLPDAAVRRALPINADGSQRNSSVQFGPYVLQRDPLQTFHLGDHNVSLSVTAHGAGASDVAAQPPLPWSHTVPIKVRGTLLASQSGSDTLALTSTMQNAEIELEVYPAPPTAVTLSLLTIGGAPSLPFFINATNSLFPTAVAEFTPTRSVVRQQWSLTDDVYASLLILQPKLSGPDAGLVTFVPDEIRLHIRSAIECHAIRVSDGSRLSPMPLYVGESASFVNELQLSCRSSLRFVTSDSLVFVTVETPSQVEGPADPLEISKASPQVPFTVVVQDTGVHSLNFAVSTASAQLDPSFFPVNPDGYTLSVHGIAAKSRTIDVPTLITLRGNEWSSDVTVTLSQVPIYGLEVQIYSLHAGIELSTPELHFTHNGPLSMVFQCRARLGAPVGVHTLMYILKGSDEPGYIRPSNSTVHVFGSISLEPHVPTLYANLPAPLSSVILSGVPPASDSLRVVFTPSATLGGGQVQMSPSSFVFESSTFRQSLSVFQFSGTPENGTASVAVGVSGSAAQWFSNSSWEFSLQQELETYLLGPISTSEVFTNTGGDTEFTLPPSSTTSGAVIHTLAAVASWDGISVFYGMPNVPVSSWANCNPTYVSNNTVYRSLEVSRITCHVAAGGGGGYRLAIVVGSGQATLALSPSSFQFPPPLIRPSSLRKSHDGFGATQVFASAISASDTVFFEGLHFGVQRSIVEVTFGPPSSPHEFQCDMNLLNDTIIGCTMLNGRGINLVFRVNVGGQVAISPDTFSYPNPPTVKRVQGCSSSSAGSIAAGCPSIGATQLTIWGTFFSNSSDAMTVLVGGQECKIQMQQVGQVDDDFLVCALPAGSGELRDIQISRVFGDVTLASDVSPSSPRISYADPTITSIISPNCTSVSANELVDCPRRTETVGGAPELIPLHIQGHHFGNSSAVVIVGSTKCVNSRIVLQDVATDAQQIFCELPLSQDTDQSVLILVPNGATNQASPAFVSFQQCPAGTFQDSVSGACVSCSRYEYQQSPGKPACDACPTNQYKSSASPSQALCALCPDGAVCSQRLPVVSIDGYWLSAPVGEVASYKCKKSRCVAGSSCFSDEAQMVATGHASLSCCSAGRAPATRNPLCGECQPGYSEWGGDCIPCDATNSGLVILFILVGYVILFGIYHITSVTSGAKLKVLVVFAQTVHAFVASDPSFPSVLGAVASFDPMSSATSCVTPISGLGQAALPMIQLLVLYLILASLLLMNAVAWLVHRFLFERAANGRSFPRFKFSAFRRVALALITMSFIPVFKATVLMGRCVDVTTNSGQTISVLQEYPSVDCTSSSYRLVFALSAIASSVTAVAITVFVVLFGQRRYRMYMDLFAATSDSKPVDVPTRTTKRRMSLAATDSHSYSLKKFVESRYGFLFLAFRASRWTASWQAVIMVRSVLLVLASALVDDWQTKFSLLTLLAFAFLAIHVQLRPYQYQTWDNQLETASLTILLLVGALNSTEWYHGDSIRAISIMLYYGYLLTWLCLFGYQFWRSGRCAQTFGRARDTLSRHLSRRELPQAKQAIDSKEASVEHGRPAAAEPSAPHRPQWAFWQYLLGWYLAPRQRYLPAAATQTTSGNSEGSHRPGTYKRQLTNHDHVIRRLSSVAQRMPSQSHDHLEEPSHDWNDSQRTESPAIPQDPGVQLHPTSDSAQPSNCSNSDSDGAIELSMMPTTAAAIGSSSQPDLMLASGRTKSDDCQTDPESESDAELPEQWAQYETDDGFPYYLNITTGQTQWERPI